MKYKNPPGNLSRIIKKAVLVTLILALIEVVIIYVIMKDKEPKSDEAAMVKPTKTEQPKTTPQAIENAAINVVKIDTAKVTSESLPETKPITIVSAPVKTDTVVKTLITKKKEEQARKMAPAAAEKIIETTLSQQAMADILSKIIAAQSSLSKDKKCVQIRKSKNSNVKNAFEIGSYLKSQGYVIAGRVMSPVSYKGVHIKASGTCIELTIGKL